MKKAGLWMLLVLLLLPSCSFPANAVETVVPQTPAAPPMVRSAESTPAQSASSTSLVTPPPAASGEALQIPFEDTFDGGMSPYWKPFKGNWKVVDGQLTADPSEDWSIILIGKVEWTDYAVDVDVFAYSRDYPIGIVVRAKDGNYMLYQATCCNTEMVLIQGKSRSVLLDISQTGLQYIFPDSPNADRFHVEVFKQHFVAFSSSANIVLSVQNAALATGQVGLAFRTPIKDTPRFDNFKITAP